MPLAALVDKALETKGQELLPKIEKAIETLKSFKPPPPESSQPPVPTAENASGSTSSTATQEGTLEGDTSKHVASDLGDFPLPIEIPGLTAPKKDKEPGTSVSTGGNASSASATGKSIGKTAKVKQLESSGSKEGAKPLKSSEPPAYTGGSLSTSKDSGKGVQQTKEKVASSGPGKPKESGKSKPEKEEKVSGEDKDTDRGSSEDGKDKAKLFHKSKKLAKVEVVRVRPEVDKTSSRSVHASKEKLEDKGSESRKDSSTEPQKTSSKGSAKETGKPESVFDDVTMVTSDNNTHDQRDSDEAAETTDKATADNSHPTGSRKRKQLPPMRRSARLASFTKDEEEKTEADTTAQEEALQQKGMGTGKEAATAAMGSDGDSDSSEHPEVSSKDQHQRPGKRKRQREKTIKSSARKKPRLLISSSEEDEGSGLEDRESELKLSGHEDDKPSQRQQVKKSVAPDGDSELSKGAKSSRKRTLAEAQGDTKSSASKRPKGKGAHQDQESKSKNRSQRLTSPVVVTRYDHLISIGAPC